MGLVTLPVEGHRRRQAGSLSYDSFTASPLGMQRGQPLRNLYNLHSNGARHCTGTLGEALPPATKEFFIAKSQRAQRGSCRNPKNLYREGTKSAKEQVVLCDLRAFAVIKIVPSREVLDC
jgi:hypothetical protein